MIITRLTVYIFMVGCVIAGAFMEYIVTHFLNKRKPYGELIFKKINDDEATVNVKLYEDCMDNILKAKNVILKVIRE